MADRPVDRLTFGASSRWDTMADPSNNLIEAVKLPGTATIKQSMRQWEIANRKDNKILDQLVNPDGSVPRPVHINKLYEAAEPFNFISRKGYGDLEGFQETVQMKPNSVIARHKDMIRILGLLGASSLHKFFPYADLGMRREGE